MKIILRQLKKLGVCTKQMELFKELFGTEVVLTEEVVKAHGAKFDVDWLAENVLSREKYADYEAKRAPLYADYRAKLAPLYADYEAKHALLYADYAAKHALLDADYQAKLAPLYADYYAKRAWVFWEVINEGGEK